MTPDFQSRELRKCVRPRGLNNKKKTKKQRRRDEVTAADEAFRETSGNIILGVIENERVKENDNISEETDRFGTDFLPVGHEDEEDIEQYHGETEKVYYNNYDKNVGFG